MNLKTWKIAQALPDKWLDENDEIKTLSQILANGVSPIALSRVHQITNETDLSVLAVVGEKTITVDDATGFVDGSFIQIFNVTAGRFFLAHQVGPAAGNVITLDQPIPFAFPAGSFVGAGITDMAVDGSVTPQKFSIRESSEFLDVAFDVTRMIFVIRTATEPNYDEFGDLSTLVNGVLLRKKNLDASFTNYFVVKSNAELQGIMFDIAQFGTTGFFGGVQGISGRFTFEKLGFPIRLEPGEDIEVIIQDNLTGLDEFFITMEGNVVED